MRCGLLSGRVKSRRFETHLASSQFAPIAALLASILILIMPMLLNYTVTFHLIVIGLVGLNGIYR